MMNFKRQGNDMISIEHLKKSILGFGWVGGICFDFREYKISKSLQNVTKRSDKKFGQAINLNFFLNGLIIYA